MKTKEGWIKFVLTPAHYDAWVDEFGAESAKRQFVRMEKLKMTPCEIGVFDKFVIHKTPKQLWRNCVDPHVNLPADTPTQYQPGARTPTAIAALQSITRGLTSVIRRLQ